ncbi:S-layer homology domain-containing protein [Paenibacillus sp. strain BS8-2]
MKAIAIWLVVSMLLSSFPVVLAAEDTSKLMWDYEEYMTNGRPVLNNGTIRLLDTAHDTLYLRYDKTLSGEGAGQPSPRPTNVVLLTQEGRLAQHFQLSMADREPGRTLQALVYDQYGNVMNDVLINWVILKTDVGQGYAASKTNVDNEVTIFPKRPGTVDIEARVNGGIKASVSIEVTNDEVAEHPEQPSPGYTAVLDDIAVSPITEDADQAVFAISTSAMQEGSIIEMKNGHGIVVYRVTITTQEPGSPQDAASVKLFDEEGEELTQLEMALSEGNEGRTVSAVVYRDDESPIENPVINWVLLDTDEAPGYAAEKHSSGITSTIIPKRIGSVQLEARINQSIKEILSITIVNAPTEPDLMLKAEAETKLAALEERMAAAKERGIDITREETVQWMSEQFLKFADWDEQHIALNAKLYEQMVLFKGQGDKLANELPDFERMEVIAMLDKAISELQKVLDGEIVRKPVPKMDWNNIALNGSSFETNGKPVFVYDYFSKPLNQSTMDSGLYNDHLGNVDHPKALSINFQNPDGTIDMERMKDLTERPNTNIGYLNLWHSGVPYKANDPASSWWGFDSQWESVWGEGIGPEMRIGRNYQYANYDIDNPALRNIWNSIFDQVVPETVGKPYTELGYMLFNEPHWFTANDSWAKIPEGISSYTVDKFREWLQDKHSSIDRLNELWGTQYAEFDEVTIQIPMDVSKRGTPMWFDWSRFNMDRVTDWLTFLNDGIVRNNPDAKTHMKIMPNVFTEGTRDHGIDLEALTEMAGMIGDDSKFRKRDWKAGNEPEGWESDYSFFWQEMFMAYDFMQSVSPEKAHINTELHSLSTTQFRMVDMKPEYVRSTFWLTTLLGMDASLTWFWGRNADGSIEQRLIDAADMPGGLGKSYPASVAQQPRVANELTQTMMDMNAFSEEMTAFQNQRKPVRVFYSETSAIDNAHYMDELFEVYEPMVFEGVPIGFATGNIIDKRDHDEWDVIAVYKTEQVTNEEFAALQRYLDQGGTVIMDQSSLKFDEYHQLRTQSLQAGSGTLIHLEDGSAESMLASIFNMLPTSAQPAIGLTEENGGLKKGSFWRVQPDGENRYVMTVVNMGKNRSDLQLKAVNGNIVTIKDMMTGQSLDSSLSLEPEGVLLLEIYTEAAPESGDSDNGGSGNGNEGAPQNVEKSVKVSLGEADLLNEVVYAGNGTMRISVDVPENTKEVQLTLPVSGLLASGDETVQRIAFDMGLATVIFPLSLFRDAENSAEIKLSVRLVPEDELKADIKQALQGNPVYDVELAIDDELIHEFGDQEVELQLDISNTDQTSLHRIVGYHLNEKGSLEVIKNSLYDEKSGKVIVRVHHFSPYTAATASATFDDLASVSWAEDSIEGLAVRGIVQGYSYNLFKPDAVITRGEFLHMLMGMDDLDATGDKGSFTDVQDGQWYSNSVTTAYQRGIAQGRGDGTFGVNDPITRQEMAVIIERFVRAKDIHRASAGGNITFEDSHETAKYARDSVVFVQQNGLMLGMGDDRFAPKEYATRAQASVVLFRLLKHIVTYPII